MAASIELLFKLKDDMENLLALIDVLTKDAFAFQSAKLQKLVELQTVTYKRGDTECKLKTAEKTKIELFLSPSKKRN